MLAAIDIGTNSVRLLIAEENKGRLERKELNIKSTRLGKNLKKNGVLSKEAIERTEKAVVELINKVHQKRNCELVRIVGTSALREADNSADFVESVKEGTGFDVDIISAKEEVRLDVLGALSADNFDTESVCLVDIGGGSTEIAHWEKGEVVSHFTSCVGAVNSSEEFFTPTEIEELLEKPLDYFKSVSTPLTLIGVGGTITSLVSIVKKLEHYDSEKVHGFDLKKETVDLLLFQLSARSTAERKRMPGLQEERADIIVGGTLILWVIMTYLSAGSIKVSDRDLLDGIILENLKQ